MTIEEMELKLKLLGIEVERLGHSRSRRGLRDIYFIVSDNRHDSLPRAAFFTREGAIERAWIWASNKPREYWERVENNRSK